jgi:hypothetical protein
MANLSTFFGQAVASGQSSELTDPTKLPYCHTVADPHYLYYGYNGQWHDGQDEFWRQTDYNNSGNAITRVVGTNYVEDTTGVANTWHTITDISSSAGYWCWAVGFSGHLLTDWPTSPVTSSLRVTIDGTAYTRESEHVRGNATDTTLSWGRPHWGWYSRRDSYGGGHYYQQWSIAANPAGMGHYPIVRSQELSNMVGGTTPSGHGTPNVFYAHVPIYLQAREAYEIWGLPKVRFENSLKVEAKISRPHPSIAAGTNFSGATPTLNQHYYSNFAYSFHYLDTPYIV